jgi:putative peptidoglycan lipid II flippase
MKKNTLGFKRGMGYLFLVIFFISLSGKIFSYLREIFIAKFFGVSSTTDAYVIAQAIPFRFGLIVSILLYTAFLPTFTKYLIADKENAWSLFYSFLCQVTFLLLICMIILSLGSNFFIGLMAPGFSQDSKTTAIYLFQLMLGVTLFSGIAGIFRAVNGAYQHYVISACSEPIASLINFISMLILVPFLGVYALALGILFAGIGQLGLQWPTFNKNRVRKNLKLNLFHPGLKEVYNDLFPVILVIAILELNFLVMRNMASYLYGGAISSLNFAYGIIQFPIGLVEVAIFTTIFPFITRQIKEGKIDFLIDIASDIIRVLIFILIPVSIICLILAEPLIEIFFQRGMFDLSATLKTKQALIYFSLGLFALGSEGFLFQIYYILKGMKRFIQLLSIRVGINILLNFILIKPLLHSGLALAFSISLIINTILSLYFLKEKLGAFDYKKLVYTFFKILFSSLVMGVLIFVFQYFFLKDLFQFLRVVISLIIGIAIYLLMTKFLNIKELALVRKLFQPI